MSTQKRKLGDKGEQLACDHLISKGYQIEATNWHGQYGELDIVARKGEWWVFIEVKTRYDTLLDDAFLSITPRKRDKLIKAVHEFLHQHDLDDVAWRIDAIGIVIPKRGQVTIAHVEDALDW